MGAGYRNHIAGKIPSKNIVYRNILYSLQYIRGVQTEIFYILSLNFFPQYWVNFSMAINAPMIHESILLVNFMYITSTLMNGTIFSIYSVKHGIVGGQ